MFDPDFKLYPGYGDIFIAKYDTGDRTIKFNNLIFANICAHGRLDIVKWMYSCGKIDIHFNDDLPLRWCCLYGYLNVVEWLYTICNGEFEDIEDPFILACGSNNIELVQWFYTKFQNKIDTNCINDAFERCCINGRLNIAQWLYSISINKNMMIHTNNDNAFLSCCKFANRDRYPSDNMKNYYKYLKIVKWLCSVCDDYKIFVDDQNKYIYYKIVRINETLNDKLENGELDEYYNDETIQIINGDNNEDNDLICASCMSNDQNKWIELIDCKHQMCLECYIQMNKCAFSCESNYKNIKLIKIK